MLTDENKSWKTAIARTGPSRPVQWVENRQRLLSDNPSWTIKKSTRLPIPDVGNRILDYGCGRGFDADYMGAEKYDPHWFPTRPEGKFDVIFCTYVLNVLERSDRAKVLEDIDTLLGLGGVCYCTVRRDIKILDSPIKYDGYSQWHVSDGDMKKAGYFSVCHFKNDFEMYVKSDYGDY